jgi:cytidylate kinase
MAIITISRLTGSGGREIATATAETLKFQFIDRKAMVYDEMARSAIDDLAASHNIVILGSGGQFLFAHVAASVHVQIVAPLPYRIARIMRTSQADRDGAEKIIEDRDREKEIFLKTLYGKDWRDPAYYDLVLNIDHFSNDVAVEIIVKAARAKGIEAAPTQLSARLPAQLHEEVLTTKLDPAQLANLQPIKGKLPEFAHPSEREFARVMDFYRISWQYEPRTFPIEWDENRNVQKAFTPDFYLPDLDLFIELTTMKQSLVTKKNRKVRLLRELYPDVNIKILYERDYKNLIWKYGLGHEENENGTGAA